MTAKSRLLPNADIRKALDTLKEYGIDPSACAIDIRADGVTVSPIAAAPGNAYERWKKQDTGNAGPSRRP